MLHRSPIVRLTGVVALGSLLGCSMEAEGDSLQIGSAIQALSSADFSVVFRDCSEFAGIGTVDADEARARVPESYALVGDAEQALIVVRVAQCECVGIDAEQGRPAIVAQIGISVDIPGEQADIDNFTLWYASDDRKLVERFNAAGSRASFDRQLSYRLRADREDNLSLRIASSAPDVPHFRVEGPVTPAPGPAVPFVASWWSEGPHGTVQATTVFPAIAFGAASASLRTGRHTDLGRLIDGTELEFPALDSYNTFDVAEMDVTVVAASP
jgi:hypothetical protein